VIRRLAPFAVLVACAVLAVASAFREAPAAGTTGTYYTQAQAASGAKLYATSCGQCHGTKLEGVVAPPLRGSTIKGSESIAQLYSFISSDMPAGAGGTLSPQTYSAIMAYILAQNGHPAGTVTLTAANVKKITERI